MGNDLNISYRLKLKKTAKAIIENTMLLEKNFRYYDGSAEYEVYENILENKIKEYNLKNNSNLHFENIMLPMFILYTEYSYVLKGEPDVLYDISNVEELLNMNIDDFEQIDYFYVEAIGNRAGHWDAYYAKERLVAAVKDHLILDCNQIIGEAKDDDGSLDVYLTCGKDILKFENDDFCLILEKLKSKQAESEDISFWNGIEYTLSLLEKREPNYK